MSFHSKLSKLLQSLPPELLPRGYQIVDKVLLVMLKPELYKHRRIIGKAILKLFPYINTVALEKGFEGVTRKPKIEVIAGKRSLKTVHKEHNCIFSLDLSKSMWSKGNKFERQRIVKLAKPHETVVDMFAGVGYWSIFLAKKVGKVYAIDINKDAVEYLRRNTSLNGVEDKIEILEGDCRKFSKLLDGVADRIVMGYLYDTEKFLVAALKIAKKGAMIHFHRIIVEKDRNKLHELIQKYGLKLVREVKVKSYAPKVWHVVFDVRR